MRLGCMLLAWFFCMVAGGSAAEPSGGAAPSARLDFVIRVDATRAERIGRLITEVAERDEIELDHDANVAAYLRQLCGARAPSEVETESFERDGRQGLTVRLAPCLRERSEVRQVVRPSDTLESFAIRNGMRAVAVESFSVIRGNGGVARSVVPKSLQPGDEVVAPAAPAWTPFRARPERVRDRDDLMSQIAAVLACGGEAPESCLARQGVVLLFDPHARPGAGEQAPADPPAAPPDSGGDLADHHEAPVVAEPVPAPIAIGSVAGVVEEQWPYDRNRAVAALGCSLAATGVEPVEIGVADVGLRSREGAPLPAGAFATKEGDPVDSADSDRDGYIDDAIGAGIARNGGGNADLLGDGDVSLCENGQPDFRGWGPGPLIDASHGAIVASVASGHGLRSAPLPLSQVLPRVAFFRLVPRACAPTDSLAIASKPMLDAFEYFRNRGISIVNVSFGSSGADGWMLAAGLAQLLAYREVLLVLPAGNDGRDLDDQPECPACLGRKSAFASADRSTLVIGAASRVLERAPWSNYGKETVHLYAPADASGALDILGDAVAAPEATSYAAPLVTLGAAMLKAMGVESPSRLRTRLVDSAWPLYDGGVEVRGAGVFDLTRIAAARFDAVEFIETGGDGRRAHRVYVGTLRNGLESVAICGPLPRHSRSAVQAIRLGPANPDGLREVRVQHRVFAQGSQDPRQEIVSCEPTGSLTIDDLVQGEVTIPLGQVTQILLPVTKAPPPACAAPEPRS